MTGDRSGTPKSADSPAAQARESAIEALRARYAPSGGLQPAAAPPWVHVLVKLMDEAIRVPGTQFRIGWDAIIGFLLPVVGDGVSALSHVTLLYYAFRAGVPPVVIARMVLNVALDELWGSVPFIGDLFDAGFRANRKNLDLIETRGGTRRSARLVDYLVIGTAIGLVVGIVLLPLILVGLLGTAIVQWLRG
jgi:hypothetical protein